jgi:NAD-dependent deacetylase
MKEFPLKFDWEKKRIIVLTGSGFSRASGIHTFRGDEESLWSNYNPADLATPKAFAQDPKLVWEWYKWRINIVLKTQPNQAHLTVAKLEQKNPSISIITQNVDNLHERAGSNNVIHVHGEILKAKCVKCTSRFTWTTELLEKHQSIPQCNECGSFYRPDVVWFGESLDRKILQQCYTLLTEIDTLIVAGTSAVVYPVAEFPYLVKRNNPLSEIYEFNIEKTPISPIATQTILGPVEETLIRFFQF